MFNKNTMILSSLKNMIQKQDIKSFRNLLYDKDTLESKEDFIESLDLAIKALEQQPCEDEYIRVPKKALKYRTAGMVAYNAEWLKKHWQMEMDIVCGVKPCDDAVQIIDKYR